MAIKNLDKTGLGRMWANIKSYISSKLPTDYINGLSVSGKVITYTKADGTNGTITTQDTNTTYSNMSQTEADTGTATTARSISAKVLNTKIENKLADYALSSGIPTKTSQLTNDSGFLTEHQSLSNYVDLSSNQIITGAKKFIGSGLYNADLVKGTLPTATSYINLALSGSNAYTSSAHRIGLLESAIDTAGTVSTYITAYKFELGSKANIAIGVRYPLNSTPYAYAPNPDNGTAGQRVATTNWVEGKGYLTSHQSLSGYVKGTIQDNITAKGALGWAKTNTDNLVRMGNIAYWDGAYSGTNSNLTYCVKGAFGDMATKTASDYVTTNTEQTITLAKTFSRDPIVYGTNPGVILRDSGIDLSSGALTANNNNNTLVAQDKNNLIYGLVQNRAMSNDRTRMSFFTYQINRADDGTVTTSSKETLYLQTEKDGSSYAYVLNTPPSTDNSTKIATTAWVTSKKYLTSHQDISGKQDKISTYVSKLTKSGNTLLIYTDGNTNSPSGSISLNTTISGDVGTTVTAYYVGITGNATGSDSWTNSAAGTSVTAPSRSKTFSYTPTVGSIYSGSYLASAKSGSGTLTNTYTITNTSAKLLTVSKQVISATATYTRPYSSSYKYLCTTASTSSTTITGASETKTYPTTTVTEGSTISSTVTCTVSTSSSKSTFLRVQ